MDCQRREQTHWLAGLTVDLMLGCAITPVTIGSVTIAGTQVMTNVPTIGSFSDLAVGTYKMRPATTPLWR